jgi:hypothetical protein
MEGPMGINNISMRISMSDAAKAPVFGEFRAPQESVKDAVNPKNPDSKFSFATTVPFVAPVLDMPSIESNSEETTKAQEPILYIPRKPSAATDTPIFETVKDAEPDSVTKTQDESGRQNEKKETQEETSELESDNKLQETKKELQEETSEKSEEDKQSGKEDRVDEQKYKRVIDIKVLILRTAYIVGKIMSLLIFNPTNGFMVSGKDLNLSHIPPEGKSSTEDELFNLNRGNSWRNVVERLQAMKNIDIAAFLTTGLFLVLTNIPMKRKLDKKAMTKKALQKAGIFTKLSPPRLSLRSR